MEPSEFTPKQPEPPAAAAVPAFPRLHLLLAGGLVSALFALTLLPSDSTDAKKHSLVEAVPIPATTPQTIAIYAPLDLPPPSLPDNLIEPPPEPEIDLEPQLTRVEETVRSGDSLSRIFQRAGLNDRVMLSLVNSSKEAKALSRLYPGRQMVFELDDQGALIKLTHHINALTREEFSAEGRSFTYQKVQKEPEIKVALIGNTISSSLYKAGLDVGLSEDLIMGLAGIFGWDIDFALDIRRGDSFRLVFEEKFLDGEKIGVGDILAAEFINQNSRYQAVRYINAHGERHYFTPSGNAMRKAFLRAPLDFRRISSEFNPRRLHPITRTVRPHRGIDYAANRGTPVWAAGDGRVIQSGFTEANGNYIVIQHGSDIQTKYLHLDRRNVRTGDRVRQKQVIGTVGSTGFSTAPHLHYEFLLNGVHRNPRTILQKLPKAESVPDGERQRFIAQTQPLLAQLEQATQLAAGQADTTNL